MTLRFYEAWTIEQLEDGTREVTDECGHIHDTLEETREHHRLHPQYNTLVAVEYDESGFAHVVQEYRHAPRRPKSFIDGFAFDLNAGTVSP